MLFLQQFNKIAVMDTIQIKDNVSLLSFLKNGS